MPKPRNRDITRADRDDMRRKYYSDNKERIIGQSVAYKKNNRERCNDIARKHKSKTVKTLGRSYVVQLLTKRTTIKTGDLDDEIIETYRHLIILRQLIKQHEGTGN